jgi:predicted permease
MGTWFRRLAYLLRQSRHEQELREEIEAHRALRAAHLEREGLTPHQADEASRRAIGNVLLAREDVRDVWLGLFPTWWQDVRYGLRSFRKNAAFTAVAVVTLALGIGVNTGIFTILNGVLFRDLPSPNAHELVSIAQMVEGGQFTGVSGFGTFTVSEYRAYRDRAQTLGGVLAHSDPRQTTLGGDTPQEVVGALVSCNFFAVLQQTPVLGRALTAQDCEPGALPVVVLGHGAWTKTFASDSTIVGRTIELDRQQFTVVGVADERTYSGSPMRAAYFAPLNTEPLLGQGVSRFRDERIRWLNLIGRRREATGVEQVRAELAVIAAQLDREQSPRKTTLTIERARPATIPPFLRGTATGAAAILMAAFGLVLLIACANVANLLLARGTARSQEIAMRFALGASRSRVVRQLLTESLLIAIAGGLLGSVLALWSFQTLVALVLPAVFPPEIPGFTFDLNFSPDVRVLSFAVLLTLGTSLVFGLLPAQYVSKTDLNGVIKQESAGFAGGGRGGRLRGTLVGVQVALSMVLMMATGLLLRGLYTTYTIDPGFTYRGISFLSFGTEYGPPTLVNQRLMDQVAALPGVEAVAFAAQTPLGESMMGAAMRLPGEGKQAQRFVELDAVTPGYFSLLNIRIVRGRNFTDAERRECGATKRHASRHHQRNRGSHAVGRSRPNRPDAPPGRHAGWRRHAPGRWRRSGRAVNCTRNSRALHLSGRPSGRRAAGQESCWLRGDRFRYSIDRASERSECRLPCAVVGGQRRVVARRLQHRDDAGCRTWNAGTRPRIGRRLRRGVVRGQQTLPRDRYSNGAGGDGARCAPHDPSSVIASGRDRSRHWDHRGRWCVAHPVERAVWGEPGRSHRTRWRGAACARCGARGGRDGGAARHTYGRDRHFALRMMNS